MNWLQICSWSLLVLLLMLRAVTSVLFTLGNYMQKLDGETTEMPGLAATYARHILNFLTKARSFGPKHRLKKITLTIKPGGLTDCL